MKADRLTEWLDSEEGQEVIRAMGAFHGRDGVQVAPLHMRLAAWAHWHWRRLLHVFGIHYWLHTTTYDFETGSMRYTGMGCPFCGGQGDT